MALSEFEAGRMRHGAFVWQESTRNHWCLRIKGNHVASVERHRSWKRFGHEKPWRVSIFGSPFGNGVPQSNNFRNLDDAMIATEKALKKVIVDLAQAIT